MENIKEWLQLHRRDIILLGSIIGVVVMILVVGIFTFSKEELVEAKIELEEEQLVVEEKDISNMVTVDIKGAVVNPGAYSVLENARVIDAIKEAGGLRDDADTSVINLGKKVTDEMVIIVYTQDEVNNFVQVKEDEKKKQEVCVESIPKNDVCINSPNSNASVSNSSSTTDNSSDDSSSQEDNSSKESTSTPAPKEVPTNFPISLNQASKEELMMISGIGEAKAKLIIEYRDKNGKFETIEDIMKVKGIGQAIFGKIKDFITI